VHEACSRRHRSFCFGHSRLHLWTLTEALLQCTMPPKPRRFLQCLVNAQCLLQVAKVSLTMRLVQPEHWKQLRCCCRLNTSSFHPQRTTQLDPALPIDLVLGVPRMDNGPCHLEQLWLRRARRFRHYRASFLRSVHSSRDIAQSRTRPTSLAASGVRSYSRRTRKPKDSGTR
jgi:hypothetical protein